MDILIKNARVMELDEIADVGVAEGKIVGIETEMKGDARQVVDAKGCLVSPAFVDPHVHLDKCLCMDRLEGGREVATLADMIVAQRTLKQGFTREDVAARAREAALMAVRNGTTATRTYVEADPIVEYRAVQGVLDAKRSLENVLDMQTIAFPQEGWLDSGDGREYESRPYIREAMGMGMEVVGGNVNRAVWSSDPQGQVDDLFELALEFDADIAIHLDNAYSAVAFTLPYVAQKTIEHGYQGRVSAAHIVSLALVPDRVAHQTIDLVREAELNVCVLPNVIRLTRVLELFEAGVNVMIATDNLRDAFTHIGHGNADMLKAMLLLAQVTNRGFDDQLEMIFRAGTYNAAKGMHVDEGYGLKVGNRADLVVIEAETVSDAIRRIPRRRAVIKAGRIIARDGELVAPLTDA
jgi:cytosine deaminase